MSDFKISFLTTTAGELNQMRAGEIVKSGFGGRTLEECVADATDHLDHAKLIQTVKLGSLTVGFAMYETFSDGTDLYLNGIVIDRMDQSKGLGASMVAEAMASTAVKRLFAVTRNPAIIRLMETVCCKSSPAIGRKSYAIADGELAYLAGLIGLPETDLPYHRGRYPADLYDRDPRHRNSALQQEFEQRLDLSCPTDAVLVVGENKK